MTTRQKSPSLRPVVAGLAGLTLVAMSVLAPVGDPLIATLSAVVAGGLMALGVQAGLLAARGRRLTTLAGEDLLAAVRSSSRPLPASAVRDALETLDESARSPDISDVDLLKTAAVADTSACIMLADADFKIRYVNTATQTLLDENEAGIKEAVPAFKAADIIGQPMDVFHAGGNKARHHLSNPDNLPYRTDIKVGPLWFRLNIASARNAEGEHFGFIVEWQEVTARLRNRAIRETLEANQILCDFAPDGTLTDANDGFLTLIGEDRDVVGRIGYADLVDREAGALKATWEEILETNQPYGKIILATRKGGRPAILDGAFSAVRDATGKVMKVLLMANDVTEDETARLEARAERERAAKEVSTVVDALAVAMQTMAEGGLRVRLETPFSDAYEPIRLSFNSTLEKLEATILRVAEAAEQISDNSGAISQSARELSRTTETQAASLEETAAALEEMTVSVKSASQNATAAKDFVQRTNDDATKGGDVVQKAIQAMRAIQERSDQINQITSVIDDISFQTNLLALNAGVEAARAGEAGRGFSVVASEVRALAQRSADSAREIKELIDKSTQEVISGGKLVDETGKVLQTIIAAMKDIDGQVEQIATSSAEQSHGLSEISAAVNSLGVANQRFVASFEETTASAQLMDQEVGALRDTVSFFDVASGQLAGPSSSEQTVEPVLQSA